MIEDGARAKDFGILLRNKVMIPDICNYLELFDIPYYTDSLDFSYDNLEVLEYINILKAIDNDKRDLVILSVLVSVVGGFTEDDLAIIRGTDKDQSFYQSFYNYKEREDAETELISKIEEYQSKLDRYRQLERTMSLYDFAWFVLIDSGYMTYLLSTFNGKAKLDNVIAFVEEIKDYEQASQPGLYNFLNYVDRLAQKKLGDIEPGAELSEEDDVVRIMTIHKSKGLQMKNVILANTERQFNMRDLSGPSIYHNDEGIALKTYDPYEDGYKSNIFFDKFRRTNKLEALSEEARLQYVALTRAEDRLIIFGEIKDDFFKKLDDNHESSKSALEWISAIVMKDKISDKFKNEFDIGIDSVTDKMSFEPVINLYMKEDVLAEKVDFFTKSTESPANAEHVGDFDFSYLDYTYPRLVDTVAAQKKTVSQLASHNDNKDTDFKNYESLIEPEVVGFDKPAFMMEPTSATAAEVGTATHFVLQLLPARQYEKATLEEELNRLLVEAKISEEEKSLIDMEAIIAFYKSELGQRVIAADKLYKEEAFTMTYMDEGQKILVDGQIDLYFVDEGGIVLIDFKTGSRMNPEIYKKQFELYELGLEKATGQKVKEKYIYWTRFAEFSQM